MFNLLTQRLEALDLGNAKFLLDIGIGRGVSEGTIRLTQASYARSILETLNMNDSATKTPAKVSPIVMNDE